MGRERREEGSQGGQDPRGRRTWEIPQRGRFPTRFRGSTPRVFTDAKRLGGAQHKPPGTGSRRNERRPAVSAGVAQRVERGLAGYFPSSIPGRRVEPCPLHHPDSWGLRSGTDDGWVKTLPGSLRRPQESGLAKVAQRQSGGYKPRYAGSNPAPCTTQGVDSWARQTSLPLRWVTSGGQWGMTLYQTQAPPTGRRSPPVAGIGKHGAGRKRPGTGINTLGF